MKSVNIFMASVSFMAAASCSINPLCLSDASSMNCVSCLMTDSNEAGWVISGTGNRRGDSGFIVDKASLGKCSMWETGRSSGLRDAARERGRASFAEFKGGVGSALGGIVRGASFAILEDESPPGEKGGVCANAADGPAGLTSGLGVE